MGDASAGAGIVTPPPAGDADLAALYKAPLVKQVNTPILTQRDAPKQKPADGNTRTKKPPDAGVTETPKRETATPLLDGKAGPGLTQSSGSY